jgi:hypothetical protein
VKTTHLLLVTYIPFQFFFTYKKIKIFIYRKIKIKKNIKKLIPNIFTYIKIKNLVITKKYCTVNLHKDNI